MFDKPKNAAVVHLVYDKKNGRIVQKHTSFDIEKDAYCKCDLKEIIDLIRNDSITLQRVTNQDPGNLDVIIVKDFPLVSSADLIVDVKNKRIIKRPRIKLSANKYEIVGDGQDSTLLEVEILDDKGKILKKYSGNIKVTTSRGRLSAKKGLIKVEGGKGNITLTSANETVDRVQITAQCLEGKCIKGCLDLEFI